MLLARRGDKAKDALASIREKLEADLAENETVVLSSEVFYALPTVPVLKDKTPESGELLRKRVRYIKRMAAFFDGLDPQVSVAFRRPDQYLTRSFVGSAIQNVPGTSFKEFTRQRRALFNYAFQLKQLKDAFAVQAWEHKFENQQEAVAHAFERMGLGEPPTVEQAENNAKGGGSTALPPRAALWIRQCRAKAKMDRQDVRKLALFALQAENQDLFETKGPRTFWRNAEQRAKFIQTSMGEQTDLVFDPVQGTPKPYVWKPRHQKAASERFTEWSAQNEDKIAAWSERKMAVLVDSSL
jgi:hypothetical protein